MIKRESHFFSFYAEKDVKQRMETVKSKLLSLGAIITIFDMNFDTGECRIGFTINPDDSVKIFLYIDTLDNYRIYM